MALTAVVAAVLVGLSGWCASVGAVTVLHVPVGSSPSSSVGAAIAATMSSTIARSGDEEMGNHIAVSNAFAERAGYLGSRPFALEHLRWRANVQREPERPPSDRRPRNH